MRALMHRAEQLTRRAWPDKEPTPERIKKVATQLRENVEREQRTWSEQKKMRRAALRERKKLCRDKYQGRTVKWETGGRWGRNRTGQGVVRDVRIRDGHIVYIFDAHPKGIKRNSLESWEVVE